MPAVIFADVTLTPANERGLNNFLLKIHAAKTFYSHQRSRWSRLEIGLRLALKSRNYKTSAPGHRPYLRPDPRTNTVFRALFVPPNCREFIYEFGWNALEKRFTPATFSSFSSAKQNRN